MLLIMAAMLALVSAFIELYMVMRISFMKTLFERYAVIGILFSFALSWAIGLIFGAEGVVVMLAGVGSTAITAAFYGLMAFWHGLRNKKKRPSTANLLYLEAAA